jgi:transposase
VLQYHFNWNLLSAAAGVTWWNFYFRLFPGTIGGPQVVEFLQHLLRHLRGKLLVIWDGLPAHRSRVVKALLIQESQRLQVEFLPAYAPELNPVEYLWGYWKEHELPNFCPKHFGETQRPRAPRPTPDSAASNAGNRFLETGRIVLDCHYIL